MTETSSGEGTVPFDPEHGAAASSSSSSSVTAVAVAVAGGLDSKKVDKVDDGLRRQMAVDATGVSPADARRSPSSTLSTFLLDWHTRRTECRLSRSRVSWTSPAVSSGRHPVKGQHREEGMRVCMKRDGVAGRVEVQEGEEKRSGR